MRPLPTSIAGEIQKRFGTEPITFIGIEWTPGVEVLYSSVKIDGAVNSIISLSPIDTSIQVDGAGVNQSVSIVLSDTAGDLRAILDTLDVHKVRARVYLSFTGLPISERVILIDGEINSPMVWDEGVRTFSFSILTRIESSEVGFSIEDGFFPGGDERQRSAAWPLRFGKTCNYRSLTLTSALRGVLGAGQGVIDPTLDLQICQARKIRCPNIKEVSSAVEAKTNPQLDIFGNPIPNAPAGTFGAVTNVNTNKPDRECQRRRFETLCQLLRDRANQSFYTSPTLLVRGGDKFPQNQQISIKVRDVRYTGVMNGEVFTIDQTFHPDTPDNPPCSDANNGSIGVRQTTPTPNNLSECATPQVVFERRVVGGAGESWRKFDEIEKSRFIWLPPGTEVTLDELSDIVHIVSLVPGTVDQVAAYRQFGNATLLTEVPTEYYEVLTTNFGAYNIVELRTRRPLSSYPGENWQDEIYVSFTSSIGPNPCDIIQWIIEKYTSLQIDPVSFASVKTLLTNYPANFVLDRKVDALTLIKDIAYQARCGLSITDDVVKIIYLSAEPQALRTITRASIESGSFGFSHTTTEQLVTKHNITWKSSGASVYEDDDEIQEFSLKNNTTRYGLTEGSWDYFTINNEPQAIKTATFWLIRRSNTWREIKMTLGMEHLDLETYDCFLLDIPNFPTVKCIVESTEYVDNAIRLTAWTPVLSGTTTAFDWAWPSTEPAGISYPGPLADFVPDTPVVIPPAGHPLAGLLGTPRDVASVGDRFPSDIGDTFPVVPCLVATGAEIIDSIQPQFDALTFPSTNAPLADRLDKEDAVNYDVNSNDDKEESKPCGGGGRQPGGMSCQYTVTLTYVTSTLVATGSSDSKCPGRSGGPCSAESGRTGNSCFGTFDQTCHTFGSFSIASAFAAQAFAELSALQSNCAYRIGQRQIILVGSPVAVPGNGGGQECVDTDSIDKARETGLDGQIAAAEGV